MGSNMLFERFTVEKWMTQAFGSKLTCITPATLEGIGKKRNVKMEVFE